MHGLRIGISLGLRSPDESLWTNGIKQNALYLAEALRHVPTVASVRLVNMTPVPITDALPWDRGRWPTVSFQEAKDDLDVLIELGGQVGAQETDYLKSRGTRLVSYCCGVEYVNAMQAMLFDRPMWGGRLFVNQRYDGLWVIPQVAPTSLHFFQTLRRRVAEVVPFVWDPVILRQRAAALPQMGEYHPRPGPRRITVMEPNRDVVKFCLYPILIVEEAYRKAPEGIAILHVANTQNLANKNADFTALMCQLDVVRNHKAVFVDTRDTPLQLAAHTDVVVSHQWGNPLNYFYFDVCWQGYPLVHNADLCRDLGYYYEGNDITTGCTQLLKAMTHHDEAWEDYAARQRQAMARFLPGHGAITQRYATLLTNLMNAPIT